MFITTLAHNGEIHAIYRTCILYTKSEIHNIMCRCVFRTHKPYFLMLVTYYIMDCVNYADLTV